MAGFSDIQITLSRLNPRGYAVHLRYGAAGGGEPVEVSSGDQVLDFRFAELERYREDTSRYGRLLGEDLFAPQEITNLLRRARGEAAGQGARLRLRLALGAELPELHALRWEALCAPREDRPLLADEHVIFSRIVSGSSTLAGSSTARKPKTMIAIANPRGLIPLNMKREGQRVANAMRGLPLTLQRPATLQGVLDRLETGFDLCYLVCRASKHGDRSFLWFEDDAGLLCHVAEDEFVAGVGRLQRLPRLLILVSDPGTASHTVHPLNGLGPRLVEAGFASVLMLLGPIAARTLNGFLQAFFEELKSHGEIDRAVAGARGAVRELPDYWRPALFQGEGAPKRPKVQKGQNIGKRIGPYRLERRLGRGGMGVVYLGRRQDEELEMAVAIKLAHDRLSTPDLVARFRRERQLLADLKHSHIAMLLDAGTTVEGRPYFIMEYIEGATIDAWCAAHQPSLLRLLRLFREVLAAVGFAVSVGLYQPTVLIGSGRLTTITTEAVEAGAMDADTRLTLGTKKLIDAAIAGIT